jgi:hypothetical protein
MINIYIGFCLCSCPKGGRLIISMGLCKYLRGSGYEGPFNPERGDNPKGGWRENIEPIRNVAFFPFLAAN